jgi:hypothetical protein
MGYGLFWWGRWDLNPGKLDVSPQASRKSPFFLLGNVIPQAKGLDGGELNGSRNKMSAVWLQEHLQEWD